MDLNLPMAQAANLDPEPEYPGPARQSKSELEAAKELLLDGHNAQNSAALAAEACLPATQLMQLSDDCAA
jgi:hypothetical protein